MSECLCCVRTVAVGIILGGKKRRDGDARGYRMAMSRDEGRSETAGGLAVYLVIAGTVMKCRRCRREGMGESCYNGDEGENDSMMEKVNEVGLVVLLLFM